MTDSAAAAGLPAGGEKSETAKQSIEDKIVIRMRKCGRYLLKDSAEVSRAESGELLSCLDEREKKELSYLLKKCLNGWKKEEK